jgi:phosphatidylinositol glycan class T
MSFRPEGNHPSSNSTNMHLLYGVLPREVVCTENLTPFLKLLPCKGKAGIATLLDGHKLFDASWQSMAIDVRPVCLPGEECVLEIEQTIDMVLDIDRSTRPRGKQLLKSSTRSGECALTLQTDNPIPRPPPGHELKCDTSKPYHSDDTCYPAEYGANQDWTLAQIFGRPMKGTCPLSDPSVPAVCLHVPDSRSVSTSGGAREIKNKDALSRCFEVEPEAEFDMVLPRIETEGEAAATLAGSVVKPETPSLYAERSFTGHGQERGGVQTILRNPSPDEEVEFVYMESLPWFMRIYLHTLKARQDGPSPDQGSLIDEVYYRPALDRARGTQLEIRMRVPPASTVFLTYDFEKSILRYTEYPPDANRGFDVAAAVITILDDGKRKAGSASVAGDKFTSSNLRTTTLLLSLPTPDFSMPYNVIIFTSTAIALAFGGMFNILVRRFVAADEGPEVSLKRLKTRLQTRLGGMFKRVAKADVNKNE